MEHENFVIEIEGEEISDLYADLIGLETCVRLKREWVVRVAEGATTPPAPPAGHAFYPLASLTRSGGDASISTADITDLRQTGLNWADLEAEIVDARGIKANVGNRLDESLTKGGQLRHATVGEDQLTTELRNSLHDLAHSNRYEASVVFTQSDGNNASRVIETDPEFTPKFVRAVAACRARLGGQYFGASAHGYADLRGSIIQHGTGIEIRRFATAPYWRQDSVVGDDYLCYAHFRDETGSPRRWGILRVYIQQVDEIGLVLRLRRQEPTTTGTGTGTATGTGTGTGTAIGPSQQGLQSFSIRLELLLVG